MTAQSADAAVGMMDAAYFTGRRELLEFFNNLLGLNLTKIEQTASGAVACQVTDYIFPGSIPMQRVNWEAKSDYEYIQNYKLLQIAFTKNHVKRHVDVEKLIRAKYQDNLEFCQWLKAFFDQSGIHRPDYDAVAVRAKGKGGKKAGAFFGKSAANYNSKPLPSTSNNSRSTTASNATTTTTKPRTTTSRPLRERPNSGGANKPTTNNKKSVDTEALEKKNAELQQHNAETEQKVVELEQSVVDIERERDFYFQKLRDIEVMLQVYQEKADDDDEKDSNVLIDKVFKVLYAAAEDALVVNDDGEILNAAEEEFEDALFEEQAVGHE